MLPVVLHNNGLIGPDENISLVLSGLEAVQATAAALLLRGGECVFVERRFIQNNPKARYYGVVATIVSREECGSDAVRVGIVTRSSVNQIDLDRDERYPSARYFEPTVLNLPKDLEILELKNSIRVMSSCSEKKRDEILDLEGGIEPQKPLAAVARFFRAVQLLFEDESLLPEADLSNLEEKLREDFAKIEKKRVSVQNQRNIECKTLTEIEKFGTKDFMTQSLSSDVSQNGETFESEEDDDFYRALEISTDHPGKLIASGQVAIRFWNKQRKVYEFFNKIALGEPDVLFEISDRGFIIGDVDRLHPEAPYPAESNRISVTPGSYGIYEFEMQFYRQKFIGSGIEHKHAFIDDLDRENLYALMHYDYRTKFKEALIGAVKQPVFEWEASTFYIGRAEIAKTNFSRQQIEDWEWGKGPLVFEGIAKGIQDRGTPTIYLYQPTSCTLPVAVFIRD